MARPLGHGCTAGVEVIRMATLDMGWKFTRLNVCKRYIGVFGVER
jgi:hypothetical protein